MSSLVSFAGWTFLPNYATSILQNIYYGITIRAGDPKPQPPSPRYMKHRRRIFIFVVTSYLLYTLYETFHQVRVAGDFYQVLGVSPLADDKTIKSRFRRLAAQHHPDKVGNNNNNGASYAGASENYFVYLKLAQDTLLDPAKRFAYDRFGPDILGWGEKATAREFFFRGLLSVGPQYVAGFVVMVFLNFIWWSNWGRYWRFYTFAALVTLELALITHPLALFMPTSHLPPPLQTLIQRFTTSPPFYLLPFQILTLARRASVTLHIFISQITPPEVSQSPSSPPGDRLHPQTVQRLGQVMHLSGAADGEATRLLQLGMAPFRGDRGGVAMLRKGMKEGLVLSSVRRSPEVQQAVARVVERRREEKKVD